MSRGERVILVAEGGEREGDLSCERGELRGKEIVFAEEASEMMLYCTVGCSLAVGGGRREGRRLLLAFAEEVRGLDADERRGGERLKNFDAE